MAKRKNKKQTKKLIGIIIAIILAFLSFEAKDAVTGNAPVGDITEDNAIYVHFIDVGQGSSTLIQQGSLGILIDAGEKAYGQVVIDYLNKVGITSLEYVVASHPHSDHIGGLDDVLYAFPTYEVIMPELEEFNTPTTRVYEDLLTAIIEKDIDTKFIFDEAYHFILNDDIKVHAITPVEQDDNLNNMSIICNIEVFDTTFAVLADAEKAELKSIYDKTIYDFSADVVALGHHGSSTSIYEPFLDAVNADVAVISCGKGNSYGHPHEEALDYISANAMTSLRTDEMGDIVFKVTEEGYSLVA